MDENYYLQMEPGETFSQFQSRLERDSGVRVELTDTVFQDLNINPREVVDSAPRSEIANPVADQKCIVPGCHSTKFKDPDKGFYGFPKQKNLRNRWIVYCKRFKKSVLQRIIVDSESKICSDHFESDQYTKKDHSLKLSAVPSVYSDLKANEMINTPNRIPGLTKDNYTSSRADCEIVSQQKHLKEETGEALCRVCGLHFNEMISIFGETGVKNNIASMINECLPIVVKKTDIWPKTICQGCNAVLEQAHALRKLSTKTENKFMSGYNNYEVVQTDIASLPTTIPHTQPPDSTRASSDTHVSSIPHSLQLKYAIEQPNVDHPPAGDGLRNPNACPLTFERKLVHTRDVINPQEFNERATEKNEFKFDLENELYRNIADEIMTDDSVSNLGSFFGTYERKTEENIGECPNNTTLTINKVECNKSETSNRNIMGAEANYSCNICGANYCSLEALKDHSIIHSFQPMSVYQPSEFDDGSQGEMEQHKSDQREVTHKPYKHQCKSCGVQFKTLNRMIYHTCLPSSWKKVECTLCHKVYRSESRMQFHMKYKHGGLLGRCEYCKKKFTDEESLYRHCKYNRHL